MGTATKLGRLTPEDELVLRLIVRAPRQMNAFPGLWEDLANPDRVACEKAMKTAGRRIPGRFNGWGSQTRLGQKKLIMVDDFDNGRGKRVPMYTPTEAGREWVASVDEKKAPTGKVPPTRSRRAAAEESSEQGGPAQE